MVRNYGQDRGCCFSPYSYGFNGNIGCRDYQLLPTVAPANGRGGS